MSRPLRRCSSKPRRSMAISIRGAGVRCSFPLLFVAQECAAGRADL
uniref:Uncharacterized protein n=1 Tax=Arundo donax TaxID=35708 RepID=A0A0A9F1Z3_ARUDO